MYFISRLVVVALFIWYSVKYNLNHFNALPVKNIPIYITVSASIAILGPLYLSFSDIYIRYPLSFTYIPLNHLTANSLTFLVPILFSLLLKASLPLFIYSITALSCPIVTTCKSGSNIPAIPVSFPALDAGVVLNTTFSGILLILVL